MKLPGARFAATLAIAFTSTNAHAVGTINLSWNDCGSHGSGVRTFACNTNSGVHTIVGSFVAPEFATAVRGHEIVMDLSSLGIELPSWWQMRTGLCRAGSLNSSFDFTEFSNCWDYWQGGAVGGIFMDPPEGNRARIKIVAALPSGDSRITPIVEGTEVYSFRALINSAKSTGAGACADCGAGVCIVFTSIRLNQAPTTFDYFLTVPGVRNHVGWQCPSEIYIVDPGIGQFCAPDCTTPARTRTWGQIKGLYR